MSEIIRFALIGMGSGAMYALMGLGIVLIYRGSGVVNFSQGALGIVGAYVFYELHVVRELPLFIAISAGVAIAALFGVVVHWLVMRPLKESSSLLRLVATLGILLFVQAAAILRYGNDGTFLNSSLPDEVVAFTDEIRISRDRLWLLAIAVVLTAVLYVIYRKTTFGLATSAVAESQRTASSLGWSPDLIASVNWALGGALAGLAAILIIPITSLSTGIFTTLTTYGLAVALVGGFASFPVTLLAGLGVGVLQSWAVRYGSGTVGLVDTLPFLIILVVLVVRGRGLPLRGTRADRLPAVSPGYVRIRSLVIPVLVLAFIIATTDRSWTNAITASLTIAVVLLSIVVLTGYAGQLSLGQYALAGLGAYICGRLDAALGWPLPLAFAVAVACAVPIGIIFGLPAVRTRGVNLAILTLVLGVAIGATVFNNIDWTGDFGYDEVSTFRLFGVDFSAVTHPERYAFLVLGVFVVLAAMIGNVRRSRVGRRMLAIRTNERAAAALGISVVEGKLYAFVLSTAIAMTGGILIAYQTTSVVYSGFAGSFFSIQVVALAVIGGVGYLSGPLFGATLIAGGVGAKVGQSIFSEDFSRYLPLLAGVAFITMLLQDPNGLAEAHFRPVDKLRSRIRSRRPVRVDERPAIEPDRHDDVLDSLHLREPVVLGVEGLTVRFGGLLAVNDVTFQIRSGAITGLIGPNGAGKTTVIDALTGFVKPSGGSITMNGVALDRRSAAQRSRAGLSRSFQSLELFEDMTVAENLLAAADRRDRWGYVSSLVRPGGNALPPIVAVSVREFNLAADLDRVVKDLSYAQRRLVAIARAVATGPKILLLDEPAAGLSDSESVELAQLLRRLVDATGMGVLLVEHDMQFVMSLCNDIVVLDFGHKIAEGAPDVIQDDPVVRAAYLGDDDLDRSRPSADEPVSTVR